MLLRRNISFAPQIGEMRRTEGQILWMWGFGAPRERHMVAFLHDRSPPRPVDRVGEWSLPC